MVEGMEPVQLREQSGVVARPGEQRLLIIADLGLQLERLIAAVARMGWVHKAIRRSTRAVMMTSLLPGPEATPQLLTAGSSRRAAAVGG